MKKIISFISAIAIAGTCCSVFAIEAIPTTSTVLVNGEEIAFDAYNIDGNNYFKLRDLAYVLNNTENQFDVGYDANTNSIFLTSGKAYTVVGGEMEQGGSEMSEAISTNQQIVKDGQDIELAAYNIDGSNYFKLRDLGEKFDFNVDYDEQTKSVIVETKNDVNVDGDDNKYQGNFLTLEPRPTPPPPTTGR